MRHASIGDLIKGSEEKLGIRHMAGLSGLSKIIDRLKILSCSQIEICSHAQDVNNEDCTILVFTGNRGSGCSHVHSRYESFLKNFTEISCLVFTETSGLPAGLVDYSLSRNVFSFATIYDEYLIGSRLKGLYREKILNCRMIHGTLISMQGVGVVLTGESGAGKSACACRMAAGRGASLVADDAILIEKRDERIYGRPHERTRGLVEVKGQGVMDAETLLGRRSLADSSRVDLVVSFSNPSSRGGESTCPFMGVELPVLEIPASFDKLTVDNLIEKAVCELIQRGVCHG